MADIPAVYNYTHMYEFLMVRTVTVINKDGVLQESFELPVADKPLVKGFNFYGSGHVQDISVNITGGYCHVWSRVLASMKDKTYSVKLAIHADTGLIIKSSCTCVAGQGGKCNHAAVTMFAMVEYRQSQNQPSCTALPQKWHMPSRLSKKQTRPTKFGERDLQKHVFGANRKRKLPLEDYATYRAVATIEVNMAGLKSGLFDLGHKTGLGILLMTSEEEMETDEKSTPNLTPEEIIISELRVDTAEKQSTIELETRGQHLNTAWHRHRKGRISASRWKDCCGKANPERIVKALLTVGTPGSKPKSSYMAYGIDHEDKAVQKFEQQLHEKNIACSIRECGLYVSLDDWQVAASPDRVGTVGQDQVVVEVKCLAAESTRHLDPVDAVILKQKDSNFAFRYINDEITLKTNHKYHYQVQMQMAMTKTSLCYMVIYTNDSAPVTYFRVPFDEDFWLEKKQLMLDFHQKYVLPALVLQRFGSKC